MPVLEALVDIVVMIIDGVSVVVFVDAGHDGPCLTTLLLLNNLVMMMMLMMMIVIVVVVVVVVVDDDRDEKGEDG